MNVIREFVKLSPGYKSAVYLEYDIDNIDKVSAYIPTEVGAKCIELIAQSLNPGCKERSFIITGTYGTGKSHLAIVLANLLKNQGIDPCLTPVMEKINHKWEDKYTAIRNYRTNIEDKPFLLVTLYQDEGKINDALLRKLNKALLASGLNDLLPETAFTAALNRINEVRLSHPDALRDLTEVVDEQGLGSIEDLERRLKNCEEQAFKIFLKLHPRFSHGAKFDFNQGMKACDVYVSVSKKIKDKGFAGIVVLWDEFGRYLERSLADPTSDESLDLMEFAETCNSSYLTDTKLFTLLIAHREMQEYLALANAKMTNIRSELERKALTIDIEKIQKRFHSEIKMKTNETEIYDLIDNVIVQQKGMSQWTEIENNVLFDIWADKCVDLKLFPELGKTKILDAVIKGSYPLHPVTTCCLPRLSEKVAQNERTLFQFLCKEEPNSVSEYISKPVRDEHGKINVMTLDLLLDYFREEAKRSDKTKKTMRDCLNAEKLLSSSPEIHRRIAKVIAILDMVSDGRAGLSTATELIAFSLNAEIEDVTKALDIMSSKGETKVLSRSAVDGTYRFFGAGSFDIDEEIQKAINELTPNRSPIRLLDYTENSSSETLWSVELNLPVLVAPKSYNDDYYMNRKITIKPIDILGLEGFRGIANDGVRDGLLLLVLCESEQEIKKAKELAKSESMKDSRILMAVPKEPVYYSYHVRRLDALKYLHDERKEVFGPGTVYHDEWQHENVECLELLKRKLQPLLKPEKGAVEFYWKGAVTLIINNQTKLEKFATEMMQEAYPNTPPIRRAELIKMEGKDTFKKHRKPVIDHLLKPNGPEILVEEVNAPVQAVINTVLKENHILVKKGKRWTVEKPSDQGDLAISKVWDSIEDFIVSCSAPGKSASLLIKILLSPPFGIRKLSIPVILAAVMRKHILRGSITIIQKQLPFYKIDSEIIEDVVADPERYTIVYAEVADWQTSFIDGMLKVFGLDPKGETGEKLSQLRSQMVSWWQSLPVYSRKTKSISEEATRMKEMVFVPLASEEKETKAIFLEEFPKAIGIDEAGEITHDKRVRMVIERFKPIKREFEERLTKLKERIFQVYNEVFEGDGKGDPMDAVLKWYKGLGEKRNIVMNDDPGRLMDICRSMVQKKDKEVLIGLAEQITGNQLSNWSSDEQINELKGQLKSIRKSVDGLPTPEKPNDDEVVIDLLIEGIHINRRFKFTTNISQIGIMMANMLNQAITGIEGSLSEEEKLTVLIKLLKEHLR